MARLDQELEIDRCPHCRVHKPHLILIFQKQTSSHNQRFRPVWGIYECRTCGGVVTAVAPALGGVVGQTFPTRSDDLDSALPKNVREYLRQALDSLHAPAGAVMLAASAVDAMLKAKGYTKGDLYPRIEKAVSDHLITKEMAEWAHDVRLDANDQRHADQHAPLPKPDDAKRCTDFAVALGQFLFVLPARVARGRAEAKALKK